MKQRTLTGVVLFLILAPLILIKQLEYIFIAVIGVLSVVGTLELLNLFDQNKKLKTATKIIILFCSLLVYASFAFIAINQEFGLYDYSKIIISLLVSLIVVSMISVFTDFDGKDLSTSLFSIVYPVIGIASLILIKDLHRSFLIYLFLITMLTDVFAYFGGMLFGKTKMAPVISPKKTWEGAVIGSLVGSIIATVFAIFANDGNNIFSLIFPDLNATVLGMLTFFISLIATVIGQIGDLVASKLKRTFGIKDFGKIFPGHGGVLDRFDSAIFVGIFLLILLML